MITLFKRLAALATLWLAATTGLFIYFNTRPEEQMEADIRRIAGPLDAALVSAFSTGSFDFEPLPADDVMRTETETTLAEVEALYDELIATREAIAAAHTDEWEKRWAGDAATITRIEQEQAIEAIQFAQREAESASTPAGISGRLDTARSTAAGYKAHAESELATAREELRSAKRAPHQD